MNPFVPHVLKVKQYQELWWSLQERLNTFHFGCIPPELRLPVRTLPSRRDYFGKVKQCYCKMRSKAEFILWDVFNLDDPLPTLNLIILVNLRIQISIAGVGWL